MVTATRLKILDPTVQPVTENVNLAPRLDTLNGKVLGLYNNGKHNAVRLLDMVGEIIAERFEIKDVVRGYYHIAHLMRPAEWKDVERCDAVLLANGD